MIRENYELIPGSGCNLDEHPYVESTRDEVLRFIFIGRVMKLKGIDEYLACAKTIKEKYPNTLFYIAGWNEEEEYKNIIENYQKHGIVEYVGFRKDIVDWMQKCHCVVLPSHGGEGVPNVLLEASATGRICIASDIDGSREVVEEGTTGYIFEVKNHLSLIAAVERVVKLSHDERIQMGLAARERVKNKFDRKIIIEKYLNEVERVEDGT
jgi:galacturonosyltransferase